MITPASRPFLLKRRSCLLITAATALTLLAASTFPHSKRLLWNATASVPRGFYTVSDKIELSRSTLLVVRLPHPVAAIASDRGYLPDHVPLIKPIAAGPGSEICRRDLTITIDGAPKMVAKRVDTQSRPLPEWQGCRRLGPTEIFLANLRNPDSFDGRYFGPISTDYVIGTARPLITEPDSAEAVTTPPSH